MFGPDAPPLEWDKDQEYTRDRVELYYLANSGRPLSQVSGSAAQKLTLQLHMVCEKYALCCPCGQQVCMTEYCRLVAACSVYSLSLLATQVCDRLMTLDCTCFVCINHNCITHCMMISHANHTVHWSPQDQLVSAMQGQWPDDYTDVGPQRYGDNAAYWCRVNEQQTLQEILWLPDHIIPGVPLFWVVAEGTQYKDRFLAQQLKA